MGEIFCGLNFQEIKFRGWLPPRNLKSTKILLSKIFARAQQLRSTRRLSVYVDTTSTRTFEKWQLVKPVECMLEPGNFLDRNTVAVEKDGIIIGYLPQKVLHVHALLRTGGTYRLLHCDWKTVGKTARQAMDI